jgi:serine/threonine protein kinase
MEIQCTRPSCSRPQNCFADLDDHNTLKTVQQRYCINCGMPLILVSRYLPVRLLKTGGFGAVFLARDRYTPSIGLCVVKQFQPGSNLTEQQLQTAQNLFDREGQVLEHLGRHPQIPQLFACFDLAIPNYQTGKQDKYFYLVQQFIDGQNLAEELTQKGKFSEPEVVALLQALLPVLQFVHDSGSIHRDLKPTNIMRDRQGQLYLLDFGAVKQATQGGLGAGSSTGVFTPGYAPPEQVNQRQVHRSTDLYALAVTCLELLSGKPPADLFDTYHNQWGWRNYLWVSDRLAEILDRMLLPVPSQRWQSALEVLEALRAVGATPLPPAEVPTQPMPRTPPPAISPTQPIFSPLKFSLLEILGGSGFIGFESSLLYIVLSSLIPLTAIATGLWGIILGSLVFAHYRRLLPQLHLLGIVAGISLVLVLFVPDWRGQWDVLLVVSAAVIAGAGAIALTVLARLIYKSLLHLL